MRSMELVEERAGCGVAALEPRPLPAAGCRAAVIVPARNEEEALPRALAALAAQVDLAGRPVSCDAFEVLVLLNNCTDGSAAAVEEACRRHTELRVQVWSVTLAAEVAHVGTARRLLMDAACTRLEALGEGGRAILSTDADTLVAEDWVATNLAALDAGADAVGGVIRLHAEEQAALPEALRAAYEQDRVLQGLVARVEALLDPDAADPWPRHLEHFGASLGCTCAAYRRAGGLPAVKPLEDVRFVEALRRTGARLRHAPEVQVWTSARLDGRAEVGLSGQLRHWAGDIRRGEAPRAQSAAWMLHRFGVLGALRRVHRGEEEGYRCAVTEVWRERVRVAAEARLAEAEFLARVDCEAMAAATFAGEREDEVPRVIAGLREWVAELERVGG